jgi:hypothetical protein
LHRDEPVAEAGANSVTVSRLALLARILDVPVGYFFAGMDS